MTYFDGLEKTAPPLTQEQKQQLETFIQIAEQRRRDALAQQQPQPTSTDLYSKLCAELGDTQYRIETLEKHRQELLAQLKALNVLNKLGTASK